MQILRGEGLPKIKRGERKMRGKNNFDEGLATLKRYKILFAVSVIIFLALIAARTLMIFIIILRWNFILAAVLYLLEMPLYFGAVKLAITACQEGRPSLRQLVAFYKPSLLPQTLLYSLTVGVLIVLGVIGVFFGFFIMAFAIEAVADSALFAVIILLVAYILLAMYMIKIVPAIFIFIERPETGIKDALLNAWVMTQDRMEDLLLICWGFFWRSFVAGSIPALVMLAAGESSYITMIVNSIFMILWNAYVLAVLGNVWLELAHA